ncbi:MAG: DUF1330 domain-containing protein [Pseudomonadota bacterium]
MAAYVIVQAAFHPGPALQRYRALAGPAIAAFGGSFVVRGVEKIFSESPSPLNQVVVIAFPSVDMARAWYDSPAYREARAIGAQAMDRELFIVPDAGSP